MKICKECQRELPLSLFYYRKGGQPYTKCIECYLKDKKKRDKNRVHADIQHKVCRVCQAKKETKEFHKNSSQVGGVSSICKECAYIANLATKYKINNIEKLIWERRSKCDICSETFGRKPHVDHDHACCAGDYTCGKCFRGLLCSDCNLAIGLMHDNADKLRSAAAYLEKTI